MSFDNTAVVDGHVRWGLLEPAEQTELLANYSLNPAITPPADTVIGDDVNAQFEQWLDGAYAARHVTDSIDDDPYG